MFGAAQVQAQTVVADATAAPGSEGLQEIVVTATKRNEDLQNVGLSITALTMEQLESKGATQFFDYANSIPNLSFGIGAADGSLAARGVAIRGIEGANTTGFYIDDTPVLETLDPHIVDVSRIEVLRGPQGTLYGAESMGGTVRIITAQPDAKASAARCTSVARIRSTAPATRSPKATSTFRSSITCCRCARAAFYQFDSGYFDKDVGPYNAPPTKTISDIGSMKYSGGQIALKFEPIEGLSFTPRIMYQQTVQDGVPYALYDSRQSDAAPGLRHRRGRHRQMVAGELHGQRERCRSATSYPRPPTSSARRSRPRTIPTFCRSTWPSESDPESDHARDRSAEVRPGNSLCILIPGPVQMILGGFYSNSTRPRDYEWTGQGLGAATGTPSDLALSFIDSRHATESAVFGDVSYDILQQSEGDRRGALV